MSASVSQPLPQNKNAALAAKAKRFPLRRLSLALALVLLSVAGVIGYRSWRQWTRPGQRHYSRGLDFVAAKDYRKAEAEWLLGVKEDPQFAGCFRQLGEMYVSLRRYPNAAVYYASAARLDPGDGATWLHLSSLQQMEHDIPAAYASAERAAALLPDDARALGQYGILAAKQWKRPQALVALRRARLLNPENKDYLFAIVNVEMDQMDLAGAEKDLAPYLQTHPDDATANYLMAVFYAQKPRIGDNLAQALAHARKAMPGMQRDLRAYGLLGQLYLDAHNPQKAAVVFERAAQFAPGSESVLHGLVDSYSRLGDQNRAVQCAALLQAATARHDRIAHLKHVMGFNPNDVKCGLELAHLEEQDGESKQAFLYYNQLLRGAPHDAHVRAEIVGYLNRAGQPALARQAADPHFVP